MHEHADQSTEKSTMAVTQRLIQRKSGGHSAYLEDNRPVANRLSALQGMAESSPRVKQFKPFQQAAIQKKENNTGLPEYLKTGVENLSGHSMDDVKVHYNSGEPAKLQARAYAQGTAIHLAPGQEKHLPHEAWHVAQQKQGRVRPTTQAKGAAINDDAGLEKEADVMGSKALRSSTALAQPNNDKSPLQMTAAQNSGEPVAQRMINWMEPQISHVKDLVDTVLAFTDFGVTPAIINGVEIPGGDASNAIFGPTFQFRDTAEGVELSVQSEAINMVGYRVELPTHPPWERMVPYDQARSAIEMLQGQLTGDPAPADTSTVITLRVHGLPNDNTFAQLVDQHEDYHVREVRAIIGAILGPWDERIRRFEAEHRTVAGTDREDAKTKFYATVGGTPAEISTQIVARLKASGLAFHATPVGGSPTIARAVYSKPLFGKKRIDVYFRHPAG